MYSAKQRASVPLSIDSPSVRPQVGKVTGVVIPVSAQPSLIRAGVMSLPAVIFSCCTLVLTVPSPLTPMKMAAAPKASKTTPAIRPPSSQTVLPAKSLFIAVPPSLVFPLAFGCCRARGRTEPS